MSYKVIFPCVSVYMYFGKMGPFANINVLLRLFCLRYDLYNFSCHNHKTGTHP